MVFHKTRSASSHVRSAARPRAATPASSASDGIGTSETQALDVAVQIEILELKIAERKAKQHESSCLLDVKAALLAAEQAAGHDDAKLRAIKAQRDRATLLSRAIHELEEERRSIHANPETRRALEARLRVVAATSRVNELSSLLAATTRDAAAAHARNERALELEAAALEEEGSRLRAVLQMEKGEKAERWGDLKGMVGVLEDAVEAARLDIAKAESDHEQREQAQRAARANAMTAAKARAGPIEKDIVELQREIEFVRDTMSDREQRQQRALDASRQREEASLREEIYKLNGEIADMVAAEEERRAEAEARAAAEAKAATEAKARRSLAEANPRPKPPPKVSKPRPPKADPLASGGKLDPQQLARLDALKGKYGEHVATRLAANDRAKAAGQAPSAQ